MKGGVSVKKPTEVRELSEDFLTVKGPDKPSVSRLSAVDNWSRIGKFMAYFSDQCAMKEGPRSDQILTAEISAPTPLQSTAGGEGLLGSQRKSDQIRTD